MKKLVFTIIGLSNSGGIERVMVNKANWLINNGGYDITIVTEDVAESFYQVDPRIKIQSLNIVMFKK